LEDDQVVGGAVVGGVVVGGAVLGWLLSDDGVDGPILVFGKKLSEM
jgi:hypothetical protein